MKRIAFVLLVSLFSGVPAVSFGADEDSVLRLKNEIIDIQNEGTLDFKQFTLCSNILGFGSYVELGTDKIKAGSTLLVYYEPFNLFTNRREGLYELWYQQDMRIYKNDGELIYEKEGGLDFHYMSKNPVLDVYAKNTLNLGNLPPGLYVYEALLKDKLKGTEAKRSIPFEIVE